MAMAETQTAKKRQMSQKRIRFRGITCEGLLRERAARTVACACMAIPNSQLPEECSQLSVHGFAKLGRACFKSNSILSKFL
jgi:hypothetical protein